MKYRTVRQIAASILGSVAGVSSVSACDLCAIYGASSDRNTATGPVFTVRVMIPEEERRRLGGAQLVAGMPADLFMKTGSHTMLSYLFKPITEQLGHAFIER